MQVRPYKTGAILLLWTQLGMISLMEGLQKLAPDDLGERPDREQEAVILRAATHLWPSALSPPPVTTRCR